MFCLSQQGSTIYTNRQRIDDQRTHLRPVPGRVDRHMVIAGRRGHKEGSPVELFSKFRGEFGEISVTRMGRRPRRAGEGRRRGGARRTAGDALPFRRGADEFCLPRPPPWARAAGRRPRGRPAEGDVALRGHGHDGRPTETTRTTTRQEEGERSVLHQC